MSLPQDFPEILTTEVPLAPRTWLRVGGPARYFAQPRSEEELVALVLAAREEDLPVRVLGDGANLLVDDDGFPGLVIHLDDAAFCKIEAVDDGIVAGGGAKLASVITESIRSGFGGLDQLVGIPGTVGGALRGNAGAKTVSIGDFVKSVDVLTAAGERRTRTEESLSFAYRESSLDELVILSCHLVLEREPEEEITRRVRTRWIQKKAEQPFSDHSAGCIFKNPRGQSASELIDDAGLKGMQFGEAEISEKHANFIVTKPGATATDVKRLIEHVRSAVQQQFDVSLDLEIDVW